MKGKIVIIVGSIFQKLFRKIVLFILIKNEDITAYRFKSMNYECLMDIEKNYQAMFKYDFSKDLEKINENYKIVFFFYF